MARIWGSGFERGDTGEGFDDNKMNISIWMKRQEKIVKLIELDDKYKDVLEEVVNTVYSNLKLT